MCACEIPLCIGMSLCLCVGVCVYANVMCACEHASVCAAELCVSVCFLVWHCDVACEYVIAPRRQHLGPPPAPFSACRCCEGEVEKASLLTPLRD